MTVASEKNTETDLDDLVQQTMRGLAIEWTQFEGQLDRTPIVRKLYRGTITVEDYQALLRNLRQQVVEGGCWISRAASNISPDYLELRSHFLKHAVTEHRDFRMLEANYESVGGQLQDIQHAEKNVGSEALSAFMYHRAGQPNPFDLLGAMFMIEGLGTRKALEWGQAIKSALNLQDDQVSFLLYHADNDDDHLSEFEDWISLVVTDEDMASRVIKTAKTVARLYALQLEEIDNV